MLDRSVILESMTVRLCENGWPVRTKDQTEIIHAGGTGWRLAKGDPAYTFKRFIDRYAREVEKIVGGEPDDWSFADRLIRDSNSAISNHGGYAVDINSLKHKRGVHHTLTSTQLRALRNLLSDFHVIRWGGDYKTALVDEMHFEIVADPPTLARFVNYLKSVTPVGPSSNAVNVIYHPPVPIKHLVPTVAPLRAPAFPLPNGSYFGPKSGPSNSISGYHSHRNDLRMWQQRMRDRGWNISVDGLYGENTKSVTLKFQAQKGLKQDGHIGPITWARAWEAGVTRP